MANNNNNQNDDNTGQEIQRLKRLVQTQQGQLRQLERKVRIGADQQRTLRRELDAIKARIGIG